MSILLVNQLLIWIFFLFLFFAICYFDCILVSNFSISFNNSKVGTTTECVHLKWHVSVDSWKLKTQFLSVWGKSIGIFFFFRFVNHTFCFAFFAELWREPIDSVFTFEISFKVSSYVRKLISKFLTVGGLVDRYWRWLEIWFF